MARVEYAATLLVALAVAWPAAVAPADADGCAARSIEAGGASIRWVTAKGDEDNDLDAWCRAVGPPLFVPRGPQSAGAPPPLERLVMVTWNINLAEGRLAAFIDALRRGDLTGGEPIAHFVVLVQELYRRGAEVPAFREGARSALAILPRDDEAPEAHALARELGLAMLYVPSMRNGRERHEDRGNAILSTEPLSNAWALELPLERQRRVAIGASVPVAQDGRPGTLRIANTHLETRSSPRRGWVIRNPRASQVGMVLSTLHASRFDLDVTWAGTVLGGDFNTIQGGLEEEAYRAARVWGHSVAREHRRFTHALGRLDHLFFRLPAGWTASSTRVDDRFGSDHHPVIGRFTRQEGSRE